MSVSILVVDDKPDVAELFRRRFRREARQGLYVMHFADSGRNAARCQGPGVTIDRAAAYAPAFAPPHPAPLL